MKCIEVHRTEAQSFTFIFFSESLILVHEDSVQIVSTDLVDGSS